MCFIYSRLSRLQFALRRNIVDHRDIQLLFFFNRSQCQFLMNVYSDNLHTAVDFLSNEAPNIPHLLYIEGNFNVRDTEQNSSVSSHSTASQTLMDLAKSYSLVYSTSVLSVFFFCLSIYYIMFDHSPQQTIYNKQPTVLGASEDRNPLYRQIETLLQSEKIRNEIQIKIAHNQFTNNASKSRETYHTETTELKETEKEKLKIYLQSQKSKTLEHSWRLRRRRRLFLRRKSKCT